MQPSGRRLRALRWQQGLTQAELAAKAGMNPTYLSNLETGKKHGGVRGWKRLAEALGVTVGDLMPEVEQHEQAG